MSTNSHAIFEQLFLKNPTAIKDIFTNVSTFVEAKDKAIADFLAVEYPELIWLIRVLHIEYDKQFSPHCLLPQQTVENIARSITLTVDEMGTTDYGQTEHNNHVLNTLKTHLRIPQDAILQDTSLNEDIISIDSSNSDMDIVYQNNTSNELSVTSSILCPNNAPTMNQNTNTQPPDASRNKQYQHNQLSMTVTQISEPVTDQNASDVIDVAQIVDQVVSSRGAHKNLSDSMHAPKRLSIVNLSPKDLRHRLNALRHKP